MDNNIESIIDEKRQNKLEQLIADDSLAIIWLTKTDSTNLVAKELARKGLEGICAANCQMKGRGRGDHTFESNEGGLYFSISYKLPCSIDKAVDFQFIAAGAIMHALGKSGKCASLVDHADGFKGLEFSAEAKQGIVADSVENVPANGLCVKYPNDIYYNGKKICGIMCEAATCITDENPDTAKGTWFVVTGIGINISNNLSSGLDMAGSIYGLSGQKPDEALLAADIYHELKNIYGKFLGDYNCN